MPSLEQRGDAHRRAVRVIVASIPAGHVLTYGDIAELIERGGPRQVAKVMAEGHPGLPWWRVVRADGTLPERLTPEARQAHLAEGTPLGADRVAMRRARWMPDDAQLSALQVQLSALDDEI